MNYGSTLEIRVRRKDGHGNVLEQETVSFYRQPFNGDLRWFMRRGGRKSKVENVTITEFMALFNGWIRAWLKKK